MKPCDWQLSLRNLSPEPPQTRYVPKAKPNPKPGNNRRIKSLPVPKHMIPTGKSFSEALILASTNPQYDKRLFIELRIQYMKTTRPEHDAYKNCLFLF